MLLRCAKGQAPASGCKFDEDLVAASSKKKENQRSAQIRKQSGPGWSQTTSGRCQSLLTSQDDALPIRQLAPDHLMKEFNQTTKHLADASKCRQSHVAEQGTQRSGWRSQPTSNDRLRQDLTPESITRLFLLGGLLMGRPETSSPLCVS